jgi:AraC-like DNA-binding protein/tetratricopeptide (TPR) repeat protein
VVSERTETAPDMAVLPRGVRRALDAMHASVGREISLAKLAAAAGVSGRALQRQFRTFLGKTPHEVLTDIRFETARRKLLRGAPGMKIMDVAARCGFPHFGRFSVAYRRRYGETPSQTLKRQALFYGTVSSRFQLPSGGFERPSVTIGPIETGADHGDVARHIEDELATALARAGVAVSARSGVARYHLTGTIKETGTQSRLILRLIDKETGRHLWAHRAEGLGEAAFDEQLATRIAAALQPTLRTAEIDRALRTPDAELTAQDRALRAMPGVLSLDAQGNARALDLLNAAMERDPDHAFSAALAAWAHAQRVVYYFTSNPAEERARSAALARRALALPADPTVLAVVGTALTLLDDMDTAEAVIGKALAVDGSSAWAWGRSGWINAYKGNADSAIERFAIALELAPNDPLAFNNIFGIGVAHFAAGRHADAARWQARALTEHPSAAWIHRTLCPAYLFAGAKPYADHSLRALRTTYPDLTLAKVSAGLPPLPPAFCDSVVEALHGTGLPT